MRTYVRVLGRNAVYIVLLLFIIIHLSRQIACSPIQSHAASTPPPPEPTTAADMPFLPPVPPLGVTAQK